MVMSTGVNAPNSTNGGVYTDARGRVVSGHFVVPPGKHEYLSVVNDQDAGISSKDRTMRYGWVHIHPCCTRAFVRQCTGSAKEEIASASVVTDIKPNGIEIKHIDAMQKDGGILFKKGGHYEIGAQYDNTTGSALDSMVTIGMLFDDVDFKRPAWALPGYREEKPFCGINECKIPQKKQSTQSDTTVREFDPAQDGPLLKTAKDLVIQTSAGPLHVTLNPAYGPQNATQIYKLLTSGVYNRTPFVRYEPNFVLQLAVAEHKVEGSGLTAAQSSLIRALPLEIEAQDAHKVKHSKYALSMAHDDGEPDSAKTSFSILLNDAPHLDGKYTIIGFLKNDAATNATMDKMIKEFDSVRPVILSCSK
jgi:cyclophilin family peptidyl-prolyl cis-trans isomerase